MAGRYGAGAAGLAVLVTLLGCGAGAKGRTSSDPRPATPRQVLERAVKRLGAVTTYQASVSFSTRVNGRSDHLDGEVAGRPKDQAMQLDVPYTVGDDLDEAMGDVGSTQVLLGGRLYVEDLNLIQVLHKPWIGIAIGDLTPTDPIMGLVATMHQTDPLPQARMFTASKDVRAVGQETVGGTSTTHYQGTFALGDALNRLDATDRAEAQAINEPYGDTVNFDVWIDGRQLIRQIGLVNRDGTKRRLNVTMNYSTFDTPVTITAPPPKDVKNLNDPKDIPA
ncbi:hypothetical protein [Actinomadura sp. DC4]|uniref:hypothetical protein n=1 Tax=Actinomadura sp. DC4 TaxID=3055069 RepID=UPI0025B1E64E|nr:hypothetical protein [Actinomadura sp. DC4]MDN3354292.1 hypothetical protein [Actinomadura sp. DC4]